MSFKLSTLITDRGAGTYYNAADLNRVGNAVQYIARRIAKQGYAITVQPKTDWTEADIPTPAQMQQYLADIGAIRGALAVPLATPETPASMAGLTYTDANSIEQILLDVDALITKLISAYYYSGELIAGEV